MLQTVQGACMKSPSPGNQARHAREAVGVVIGSRGAYCCALYCIQCSLDKADVHAGHACHGAIGTGLKHIAFWWDLPCLLISPFLELLYA